MELFLLGFLLGSIIGMSIIALISIDKINESESLARASRKSLANAEDRVKERNKLIKIQSEDIKTLKNKIVDLENNIELLVNNSKNKKIKELVTDSKSEN